MIFRVSFLLLILAACNLGRAAVREVGPNRSYRTPCQAIAAAADGDQILIDATGSYDGDVCVITANRLTLRGVNGRPRLNAAGRSAERKGIWVIRGNSTLVENIEFTGARVPDRNGAGIRQEGLHLTVRNCYFHHNETGILTGASGRVIVEYCEFAYNGHGDGQSHNLYVNHASSFLMRFCYSHHSIGGQLAKSRAAVNYILYNRLTDEGGSNYEIDLSNGGLSYVIGNVIQKSSTATNRAAMLSYLAEGASPANPDHRLFVAGNTFVNHGPAYCRFLAIFPPSSAIVRNNIFAGAGILAKQPGVTLENNFTGDPRFVNPRAFDYHLTPASPAIGAARAPGADGAFSLAPQFEYRDRACGWRILPAAKLDAGAFQSGASREAPPEQPRRCSH